MDKPLRYFNFVSLLTLISSFILVALGGLVHNTGSSLACPDWPLCFGQVFPKMEGNVAIEHSHRLLAALVGIFCIALVAIATKKLRTNRYDLFKISLLALGLVIFQGLLGGITVILKISPIISTLHLATSQIFLAAILWLFLKSKNKTIEDNFSILFPVVKIKMLSIALTVLFLQIVLGAFIRHSGASVACGLGPESSLLCADMETQSLTLFPQSWPAITNMIHRALGFLLIAIIVFFTMPVLKWSKANNFRPAKLACIAMHITVLIQVLLGVLTISTLISLIPVTLHLVFAMILWLTLWGTRIKAVEWSQAK